MARLVSGWMRESPLRGPNSQWPWQGQDTTTPTSYLFPGRLCEEGSGNGRRAFGRPISERGYLGKIHCIAQLVEQDRQEHHQQGWRHQMDGINLSDLEHAMDELDTTKLGTHSFKRSGISILKDHCRSTAVVAAISGTSIGTISRVYDCPSSSRQRNAQEVAFKPIIESCKENLHGGGDVGVDSSELESEVRFCSGCGATRSDLRWVCCPFCQRKY